jgi:hypothetical protein
VTLLACIGVVEEVPILSRSFFAVACAFHTATASASPPNPKSDRVPDSSGDFADRANDPLRAVASVGVAGIFFGYDSYGVAFPVRAGVDIPLGRLASTRHRLLAGLEYAHFSRGFVAGIDPFPVRGLAFDEGSFRLVWRVLPFARLGLHVDAGAGVLMGRDEIHLELPERVVRSSETRTGVPFEFGAGFLLGEHLDLGLRYTHVVFPAGKPAWMSFPELAVAVRL